MSDSFPRNDEQGLAALMPRIACLMSQVRCQVSRICRQAGYPLTPEEADMLMIIRHCNGCSQSHLAAALGKDRAAVTRLISALVNVGLVAREQDARDRRVVRAYITDAGEQAFVRIWPALRRLSDRALAGMAQSDLKQLCTSLDRINANLDALSEGEGCPELGREER